MIASNVQQIDSLATIAGQLKQYFYNFQEAMKENQKNLQMALDQLKGVDAFQQTEMLTLKANSAAFNLDKEQYDNGTKVEVCFQLSCHLRNNRF
jgi:hypothetical protein